MLEGFEVKRLTCMESDLGYTSVFTEYNNLL